ncbi:MAG: DUF2075 domain-containing protein [Ignavibacterium sp.]|nr:DUF2075 domain-containing protein [Ignavibacterium sp.]MDW8374328.1 hypothetical protein [Ignavibacteriales bacterium]
MLKSQRFFYIITFLIIVVSVIRVALDKYFLANVNNAKTEPISQTEVERIFLNSLQEFQIDSSMFNFTTQNGYKSFDVKVFQDLPIDLVLLNLQKKFSGRDVIISSSELSKNKRSITKISSNNRIILKSEFIIDTSLTRIKNKIGFLIKVFKANEISKELLESTEQIAFLFNPSKIFYKPIKDILNSNKKYCLLVNEDIDDLIYKLDKSYSKILIKNTINNIIRDFDHFNTVIVDNSHEWLTQDKLNLIKNEFRRNKVNFVIQNTLVDISELDDDIYNDLLNKIMKMKKDEDKIFIINRDQYLNIYRNFPYLRKMGYKIVNPTQLL